MKSLVRSAAEIDISEAAVDYAREKLGANAIAGDYLATDLGRKFDLICMWDTVEHLRYPHRFIAKVAEELRPGGMLALTTGDIGTINARIRGHRWRMIHPPTHLHFFSLDTMRRLLERYGFHLIYASHPGNSRKLRSIFYYVCGKKAGMATALAKCKLMDLSVTLNLFDIMHVVAERRQRGAREEPAPKLVTG